MRLTQGELTIRDATIADAPTLGNWWRDGAVMAHAGLPNGLDVTDEHIAAQIADTTSNNHLLIIEIGGEAVGETHYRDMSCGVAQIGMKICEPTQQEKGYGTRLYTMLMGELFGPLGFEKTILSTNPNNLRARHVYKNKLGFREVGIDVDSWQDQLGELQSSVHYEMRRDEFRRS